MKKKIFSILFAMVMIIPCLMLTACGKIKSLEGKTLVYSKVVVTESLKKEDYKDLYKKHSFEFSEDEVIFNDGSESITYFYKLEKGKVYLKSNADAEFSTDSYAEIDGNFMVVSQTVEGGVVKVYFKVQ